MISVWLAQLLGMAMFEGRLFRAGSSALFAFIIIMAVMPWYIRFLKRKEATADFNDKSPPIFGGLLLSIVVILSTLLFAVPNTYVLTTLVILIVYTAIGAADDISKIRAKRRIANGLENRKSFQEKADGLSASFRLSMYFAFSLVVAFVAVKLLPHLSGHLSIPFIKPDIWYPILPTWLYILLVSFVVTSSANGANFTDGMDSLVSVPIITTCLFIASVAYISGNAIFSNYLLLPYFPGVDELMPVCAAIIGATLAYLWFNCPPAEIYMGDSGSIGFGGAIGMMFVLVKAELFLPIVAIVFLTESLSVVLQISYFKYTRKRFGEGQRIFRRAPIHDHFKLLWADKYGAEGVRSKVVWRFHLVSVIALIVGLLIFFKVR
jgi:phospho-N-acetylmuramoyl-pentapeptide-transferase